MEQVTVHENMKWYAGTPCHLRKYMHVLLHRRIIFSIFAPR